MPRFFFYIRTPEGRLIRDDLGVDLADVDAAAREANATARGLEIDVKCGGRDYSGCYFGIRSDSGSLNMPAFVAKLKTV